MNSKLKLALRIFFILLIGSAAYYLNRYGILKNSLQEIESLGVWAPFLFVLLYILASVFFVPSIIFAFAGGMLFGFTRGFLLSVAGLSLGALCAFLIGRYLAKNWILKKFGKSKRFQLLNRMVLHKGWKIVALARLSPVLPFFIGNYLFGLTPISARSYFAASLLGTLPSKMVYVYLGTLSRDLTLLGTEGLHRTPLEWALLFGGMIATLLLTLYLQRTARHALVSLREEEERNK